MPWWLCLFVSLHFLQCTDTQCTQLHHTSTPQCRSPNSCIHCERSSLCADRWCCTVVCPCDTAVCTVCLCTAKNADLTPLQQSAFMCPATRVLGAEIWATGLRAYGKCECVTLHLVGSHFHCQSRLSHRPHSRPTIFFINCESRWVYAKPGLKRPKTEKCSLQLRVFSTRLSPRAAGRRRLLSA